MMNAIRLISEERIRQVASEGWTPEHDAQHTRGELSRGGLCYAWYAAIQAAVPEASQSTLDYFCDRDILKTNWPWERRWWKPAEDRLRNLVKGAALMAAEIDRELRLRGQYMSPESVLFSATEVDQSPVAITGVVEAIVKAALLEFLMERVGPPPHLIDPMDLKQLVFEAGGYVEWAYRGESFVRICQVQAELRVYRPIADRANGDVVVH